MQDQQSLGSQTDLAAGCYSVALLGFLLRALTVFLVTFGLLT